MTKIYNEGWGDELNKKWANLLRTDLSTTLCLSNDSDKDRIKFWRDMAIKLASPDMQPELIVAYIKDLEDLIAEEWSKEPNGL